MSKEEVLDLLIITYGGKLYNRLLIVPFSHDLNFTRACNIARNYGYKIHTTKKYQAITTI